MAVRATPSIALGSDPITIRDNAALLNTRLNELEAERKAILALLRANTSMCSHPTAKRGYNEREGSWMSRCEICGHSE